MSTNCIFCKIVSAQIPSKKVYEDEQVYAFEDLNPAAPVHVLIVPKVHIDSLNAVLPEHALLLGSIQIAAARIAATLGIADKGYRLVSNCNAHGGQTVFHLHYHLIGGAAMGWPPFPTQN